MKKNLNTLHISSPLKKVLMLITMSIAIGLLSTSISFGQWVSINPNLLNTFAIKYVDYNKILIYQSGRLDSTTNGGISWSTSNASGSGGVINNNNSGFFKGSQALYGSEPYTYICGTTPPGPFGGGGDPIYCTGTRTYYIGESYYISFFGTSWVNSIYPGRDGTLYFFIRDFYSMGNNCWCVGTGGGIKKSIDKGNTWVDKQSGTTNLLTSVFFLNELIGWTVGIQGTILKTNDGGDTWAPQTSGITEDLKEIEFIDQNTGWAVGAGGKIIKTIDGGQNWFSLTSGLSTDITINNIRFINSSSGWVVGSNSSASRTSDGGKTWVLQNTGFLGENFISVFFTQSNKILIGSTSGRLLKFDGIFPPILGMPLATNILEESAQINSDIYEDGGSGVFERGVCWNIAGNPTISDNKISSGNGIGQFQTQINGLTGNTTYYVRSYATNSAGTSYSDEISFSTLKLITVGGTVLANITDNSAFASSSIIVENGNEVLKRGFCWSTTPSPNISLPTKTEQEGSSADFTGELTGLQQNTKYYVRAYAQNLLGTSYGEETYFTTYRGNNTHKLSFQGYLTDLNGIALPDGNYNIVFKLYNKSNGEEDALWVETQSVMLSQGVMSVILGASNPINLAFDASYYLGVTLEGQDELSPRFPLVGPVYPNGGFGR